MPIGAIENCVRDIPLIRISAEVVQM